ncbi:hypothetical protein TNCV_363571 [Trichonephila clavipes]|nr:hypothetical protein TNCV_363571 [Trichonephila clavipes]
MLKELLRRNLGKTSLQYDELHIIVCECEALLSSRPFTYLSEDPSDLVPVAIEIQAPTLSAPFYVISVSPTPALRARGERRKKIYEYVKWRRPVRGGNFGFYGRTATQGEKNIFGSRVLIEFSFGEGERLALKRSNGSIVFTDRVSGGKRSSEAVLRLN